VESVTGGGTRAAWKATVLNMMLLSHWLNLLCPPGEVLIHHGNCRNHDGDIEPKFSRLLAGEVFSPLRKIQLLKFYLDFLLFGLS
jgi:hypothetical protein